MPAQRDAYTSPAIRAFARELTAHREHAHLKLTELADLLGYTHQYLGQVEACKNRPSRKFAQDCDTYFTTIGVFERLWKNIDETHDLMALPPGFTDYVAREGAASEARIYSALLFDGPFQCESYAKAILSKYATGDITDLLARRMGRGAIFTRDVPPQVFLILDEGVLRRIIGGARVMEEQLQFILKLCDHPTVQIQVVPYDDDYHKGLGGSLAILDFDDGNPTSGYVESGGIGIVVDQPAEVSSMVVRYDLIRGHALSVGASRALIQEVMQSYARAAADQVA